MCTFSEFYVQVYTSVAIINSYFFQNRKNDEMAYMQMLKLKRDLARARYKHSLVPRLSPEKCAHKTGKAWEQG